MAKSMIKKFIELESSAGILLFGAAILALLFTNSSLEPYYHAFNATILTIQVGALNLSKPLLLWINEGLMVVFFLLVTIEIKREIVEGELSSLKKSTLPAIAAFGGMFIPALFYLYFTHHDPMLANGWAIPTATDIAFSLGILSLFGSRVPVGLKLFLTALAIFDDIGGVAIIALYYTSELSHVLMIVSLFLMLGLFILNRKGVTSRAPYFLLGLVLWVCVLKSGLHATLVGVFVALAIPLRSKSDPHHSPAHALEKDLHPWVAFMIIPLFAFTNAGVSFIHMPLSSFFSPIAIGIALGLFLGKQIGIYLATWIAVKLRLGVLPNHTNWGQIYGVSLLAGVGFTMSLFIGSLSFGDSHMQYGNVVRSGVLVGSLLSGVVGYWVLRYSLPTEKIPKAK